MKSKLSRRAVLAASAASASLAFIERLQAAEKTGRAPNILWLVSEDNNPYIGAYGDRLAHTPAIDSLAESGVLYRNAFCNAPVCAPSRFGIITGMYAESCGPAHHHRASAKLPVFLKGFPKYLRDAGYYCTNNDKTDYNTELDMQETWNDSSKQAHWRNRPGDAPFFAVFNSLTTHESQVFKVTDGKVKPENVRVPEYLPDVPEVRRDIASYYNRMEMMDGEIAAWLAELDDAGLAEDTIVFYYSDNGGVLPRSKRYCYDEGMRCALVVRVPSKWAHLAPASPGSVIESPVSFIDLAPTVLALAGLKRPSYMQGVPFMGARRPQHQKYAFGMRNRMDERYDMMRTVSDGRYRYIRNYSPHRIYAQHSGYGWYQKSYQAWEREHLAGRLNTVQERFWGDKPAEEFYDLQVDRDQVANLIDAPEHRRRIDHMRASLDEHMIAVNDNGFIPEGSPIEGYEASRERGAYPLKDVLRLAGQCIRRDTRNIDAFIAALSDRNEVIRYWGAQGLLMLKQGATPAKEALESRLQEDSSPSVRIVVAEALVALGETDGPVTYLVDVAASNADVRVRLQALNALTWIGEATARPSVAAIERVAANSSKDEYTRQAAKYLRER